MGEKHEYYLEEHRKIKKHQGQCLHDLAFELLSNDNSSIRKNYLNKIMNDSYDVPKYSEYLLNFNGTLGNDIFEMRPWDTDNARMIEYQEKIDTATEKRMHYMSKIKNKYWSEINNDYKEYLVNSVMLVLLEQQGSLGFKLFESINLSYTYRSPVSQIERNIDSTLMGHLNKSIYSLVNIRVTNLIYLYASNGYSVIQYEPSEIHVVKSDAINNIEFSFPFNDYINGDSNSFPVGAELEGKAKKKTINKNARSILRFMDKTFDRVFAKLSLGYREVNIYGTPTLMITEKGKTPTSILKKYNYLHNYYHEAIVKLRYQFMKTFSISTTKNMESVLKGSYKDPDNDRIYLSNLFMFTKTIYDLIPSSSSGLTEKKLKLIALIVDFYNSKHIFRYKKRGVLNTKYMLFKDFIVLLNENGYNSTDRNFSNFFIEKSDRIYKILLNINPRSKEETIKQTMRKFINQGIKHLEISQQEYNQISHYSSTDSKLTKTKLKNILKVIKK